MGKKNNKGRDNTNTIEEESPDIWCFYCDREFETEKILIEHQKARHFKCQICSRKLNSASGLNVHMTQVHKETIKEVPNAKPGRESLEVDIHGMLGVPLDMLGEGTNKKPRLSNPSSMVGTTYPAPPPPRPPYSMMTAGSTGAPPPPMMAPMIRPNGGMVMRTAPYFPASAPGYVSQSAPPNILQGACQPPTTLPLPPAPMATHSATMQQQPYGMAGAPPRPPLPPNNTTSAPAILSYAAYSSYTASGLAPPPPPPKLPPPLNGATYAPPPLGQLPHKGTYPPPPSLPLTSRLPVSKDTTTVTGDSTQPTNAPADFILVYNNDEMCMEEARSLLPRYRHKCTADNTCK